MNTIISHPRSHTPEDTMNTIMFNGTTYTCPFADLMPALTQDERAELRANIQAHGRVNVAVVVTDDREVLDGHNRLSIAAELGLTEVPFDVRRGLTAEEKRPLALDLNLHRRHLTREQKQHLIAVRLKEKPTSSNREIAGAVKADDKTVAKVRKQLESTAEIPQLAATQGKDGKTRKTKRRSHAIAEPKPSPNTNTPNPGAKLAKTCSWWTSLLNDVGTTAKTLNAEITSLKRVKVCDRKDELILNLARRFQSIAEQMTRQATERCSS